MCDSNNLRTKQVTALSDEWAERFPLRLTRKQKERFLAALEQEFQTRGFETKQINLRHWGISNRLLMTKCESPGVIFLAHYDTPTMMPPGIAGIYRLLGHTRQGLSSVVTILLLLVMYSGHFWLESFNWGFWADIYLLAIGILLLIPIFFPNPHNREDNTSGVLGLLALADWAKDKPLIRQHTQFIFLDNEEWGLIGSKALKRLWIKRGHPNTASQIINLDCVSRGQKPLVVYHHIDRLAQRVQPYLQQYLPAAETIDMKNTPLSDNFTFREIGSIDISLANPAIIPGGYYIPRVHTPSDNDFSPSNFSALIEGLTDFLSDYFNEAAQPESDLTKPPDNL